jgi:hypothetical protein
MIDYYRLAANARFPFARYDRSVEREIIRPDDYEETASVVDESDFI